MTTFWGIDSCELSNHIIPNTGNKKLLKHVTDQLGKPDFWGRYIGGNSSCPNGVLTLSEIKFLHDNGIKILVIYNGASPSHMIYEQEGIDDANKAINIATDLGISYAGHEVIIYLDIEESWTPTPMYLHGWSKTLNNTGVLIPGFYCNTISPNFLTSFCAARLFSDEVDKTVLYTTQPQKTCTNKAQAPSWNPQDPICIPLVHSDPGVQVWQYSINCLGGFVDLDLMTSFAFDRTF
ncbi:TPA: DUF1906 domain-containing protein [Bacillus toyonensis]|nr:DUF1906 domain-containing protein [Bacillus toyonensis]